MATRSHGAALVPLRQQSGALLTVSPKNPWRLLTAHTLRVLSHIHIGLIPQVRRQRSESVPPSWFLCQPLQPLLHKPLYPLVSTWTHIFAHFFSAILSNINGKPVRKTCENFCPGT